MNYFSEGIEEILLSVCNVDSCYVVVGYGDLFVENLILILLRFLLSDKNLGNKQFFRIILFFFFINFY